MRPPLAQLAVIGPGLIGGSLALAARRLGLCARLTVWSRDAAERQLAGQMTLADLVTDDLSAAVDSADLVLLCTPPAAMPGLAAALAPHLAPAAVVSEVASVKAGVAAELSALLGARYAGSHPMAGAERHGLDAAREDLFAGSVCLLTSDARTAPDTLAMLTAFWRDLGARVQHLSPVAHDEVVALVSHLPHVLAAALMEFVGAEPGEPTACAGPGWRDMTRLAGGSPELWTEILSRNRGPVTYALRGMMDKLHGVLEVLETGRDADLEAFLQGARTRRGETLRRAE